MSTTALDHLVAFVLVVVVPLYVGLFAWPRIRDRLAAGDQPDPRVRMYWANVAVQWTLTAAVVSTWLAQWRGLADLGLGPVTVGWRFWVTTAGAVGIAVAIVGQYLALLRSAKGRSALRAALVRSAPFVPRNRRELGHFAAVGITAGVCEEILYRGFLIWYACAFTGTTLLGLVVAVTVTSAIFAACHLYQGSLSAIRIGALSVVFGTLYVVAETLWIVIVLHAVIDVAGGAVAVAVRRAPRSDEEPAS